MSKFGNIFLRQALKFIIFVTSQTNSHKCAIGDNACFEINNHGFTQRISVPAVYILQH